MNNYLEGKYGAVSNVDFTSVLRNVVLGNDSNETLYSISVDIALLEGSKLNNLLSNCLVLRL